MLDSLRSCNVKVQNNMADSKDKKNSGKKKAKGKRARSKVPSPVKIRKRALDSDILRNLERLARVMRSAQHSQGLNPAKWEALRYIALCNRYSDSPTALTGFLAATKGTVSQTIKALEKKGLIIKTPRADERRSLMLSASDKGLELLKSDPLASISESISGLGGKSRRKFAESLAHILKTELAASGNRIIGVCRSCRYHRENGAAGEPGGPHQCLLFNAPLNTTEADQICVEYQPA